jgi:hypothetical protein
MAAELATEALMRRLLTGGAVAGGTAAAGAAGTMAAGGAGAGAAGVAGGTGAAAAGMSLAGLAVAGLALTAALAAVSLVAYELAESFSGNAQANKSLTFRIAKAQATLADWIGDATGLFDVVTGSKRAKTADKELEERKKKEQEREIVQGNLDTNRAAAIKNQRAVEGADRDARERVAGIGTAAGTDARQDRLAQERRRLERQLRDEERRAKEMRESDPTNNAGYFASQQEQMRLRSAVAGVEGDVASSNADEQRAALERQRLDLAQQLRTEMELMARLDMTRADSVQQYEQSLQRAQQVQQQMADVSEQELAVARQEADERKRINEQTMAAAERRIEMSRQEEKAARDALNTAAERFASMSKGDQRRAKEAMELVRAGREEELTDKQRKLLRQVGTEDATAAAQRGDRRKAEEAGFFDTFGDSERERMAAAQTEQANLQVQVQNLETINVQIETNYQQLAAQTAQYVEQQLAIQRQMFQQELDERLEREEKARTAQANQQLAALRNGRPR